MLILTSAACRTPAAIDAAGAWPDEPGGTVFVALPGHGLGRAGLMAIEAEAVVVECLTPPDGAAGLLGAIAARLPWLLREGEGPLLFADAPIDAATLRARRRDGLDRPHAIAPAYGEGGVLRELLLGAEVAMHPLAGDALAAIAARRPTDATLVALLAAALGATTWAAPAVGVDA